MRILILLIALSLGCDRHNVYRSSEVEGWHKIDLKAFELSTPKEYKFTPHQGIDSFVGEISNGQVVISFDYGCYSWPGPRDKVEAIARNAEYVSLASYSHLHFLLDLTAYENDGSVDISKVIRDFQNVQLLAYSDTVELSVEVKGPVDYYYTFEFQGETYKVPFDFYDDTLTNEERYVFKRDTIDDLLRKTYYDRVPSDTMKYGLYLVDLAEFNESMNAHCRKLGLVANSVTAQDLETVEQIIASIRFKELK